MKIEALRKLTLKGVAGKVNLEKLIKAEDKHLDLAKIWGTARRAKAETFQMPDGKVSNYLRFIGRFQGINLETGEIFESGACILPGIAQDLLAGELEGDGNKEVMFGFLIGVNYVPDASVPFEYTVTSLIELTEDDPMLRIAGALGINMPAKPTPQLSNPTPPAAPDDEEIDETDKAAVGSDTDETEIAKAASAKNSGRNRGKR
jgi:hypothetical protein